MSWLYRTFIRPTLFAQDSETIHNWTIQGLGRVSRTGLLREALASWYESPAVPVTVAGIQFPNPVGLAAGMDKEGDALPAWQALGFGFCELGAVTWHAQPGNPKPRVFRAIAEEALINRMGFNNPGAEALAERLARWRREQAWPDHPVGINLGKSKVTPLAEAPSDYANSLRVLWAQADFFVVNVSSPNTPNLRQLQEKSALDEILAALQEVNRACATQANERAPTLKPLLVKVAPELSFEALDDILDLVSSRQIAGIVATNTTVERPLTPDHRCRRAYAESGGLSGKPLRARSTELVGHLYRQTEGKLPIIGVGGIFDVEDAWEKITAGASLVQVYTGLVYEGPGVVCQIVSGLRDKLEACALESISQAVGLAWRACM